VCSPSSSVRLRALTTLSHAPLFSLSLSLPLSLPLSLLKPNSKLPSRRHCTGHIIGDCFGVCTQTNWCVASCRITSRFLKRVFCVGEIKHWFKVNKVCLRAFLRALICNLCCGEEEEEDEEKKNVETVKGHGEYDIEIKEALEARYDAAIKELVRRIDSRSHSPPQSLQ